MIIKITGFALGVVSVLTLSQYSDGWLDSTRASPQPNPSSSSWYPPPDDKPVKDSETGTLPEAPRKSTFKAIERAVASTVGDRVTLDNTVITPVVHVLDKVESLATSAKDILPKYSVLAVADDKEKLVAQDISEPVPDVSNPTTDEVLIETVPETPVTQPPLLNTTTSTQGDTGVDSTETSIDEGKWQPTPVDVKTMNPDDVASPDTQLEKDPNKRPVPAKPVKPTSGVKFVDSENLPVGKQLWSQAWRPFFNKETARGFAEHLSRETELDFRIRVSSRTGEYTVEVAHTDAEGLLAANERLYQATGYKANDINAVTMAGRKK